MPGLFVFDRRLFTCQDFSFLESHHAPTFRSAVVVKLPWIHLEGELAQNRGQEHALTAFRPTLGRSKSYGSPPTNQAAQRSILDDITDILHQYPAAALARRPANPLPLILQVYENNSQPVQQVPLPSIAQRHQLTTLNEQRVRLTPPLLRLTSAPDLPRTPQTSPTTDASSSPTPSSSPILRAPPLRRRQSMREPSPDPPRLMESRRNAGLGLGLPEETVDRRRQRRFSPMRRFGALLSFQNNPNAEDRVRSINRKQQRE